MKSTLTTKNKADKTWGAIYMPKPLKASVRRMAKARGESFNEYVVSILDRHVTAAARRQKKAVAMQPVEVIQPEPVAA